jgi:hypothetical protein
MMKKCGFSEYQTRGGYTGFEMEPDDKPRKVYVNIDPA